MAAEQRKSQFKPILKYIGGHIGEAVAAGWTSLSYRIFYLMISLALLWVELIDSKGF